MLLSIDYPNKYVLNNQKNKRENLTWQLYLAHKSCDTYLWTYDTFVLGRDKTIVPSPWANIAHRTVLKMNNMIPDTEMNEMTKTLLFYNSAE